MGPSGEVAGGEGQEPCGACLALPCPQHQAQVASSVPRHWGQLRSHFPLFRNIYLANANFPINIAYAGALLLYTAPCSLCSFCSQGAGKGLPSFLTA